MKLKEYIGNTYSHPTLGDVKVNRIVPKSRTKLEVTVVDRGPGYNEERKRYTGIRKGKTWTRGENRQRGHVDETHFKELTKSDKDYG